MKVTEDQDHDRTCFWIRFKRPAETQTIQTRHQDFSNNDFWTQLPRSGQGQNAIARKLDGVARLFKKESFETLNGRIALNNQNKSALRTDYQETNGC